MSGQHTLTLSLQNSLSEISRIASQITDFGEANDWPKKWIANTNLMLDELITNSISYGNLSDKNDAIRILLSVENGKLTIIMEDEGIPFNPFEEANNPDIDADIEERLIGGLGVFFVKELSNFFDYQRINGMNRITLIQETGED